MLTGASLQPGFLTMTKDLKSLLGQQSMGGLDSSYHISSTHIWREVQLPPDQCDT